MRRFSGWAAVACLVAGALMQATAYAHHSFSVYDLTKKITVRGTVNKVMWVNPHAYFMVDVTNEDGTVTTWEFFLHSTNEMGRSGWSRNTLKPGDMITVEASPSRGRATRGFTSFVTMADGRKVLNTEEKY